MQDSIPVTQVSPSKVLINLAKPFPVVIAPIPPRPQTHWAKVVFCVFQFFLRALLLICDLPISIYIVYEINNLDLIQEELEDPIAALMVSGVLFIASGSWMLWSSYC